MIDFCYEAHFRWFERILIRDFNVNFVCTTFPHVSTNTTRTLQLEPLGGEYLRRES
jgi:hypothetical protein